MFVVPPIVINPFFIASVAFSGWQHVRMQRANPIFSQQFGMMAVCPVLMLITAFNGRVTQSHQPNPWVSLVMLLLGIAALVMTLRQNRLVPPRRRIE